MSWVASKWIFQLIRVVHDACSNSASSIPPIVSSHRIARLVVVESTRVRCRLWFSVRKRLFVLLFAPRGWRISFVQLFTPREWLILLIVLRGRGFVFERRSWLRWRTCNSISRQLSFSIHAVAWPSLSALDVRECFQSMHPLLCHAAEEMTTEVTYSKGRIRRSAQWGVSLH